MESIAELQYLRAWKKRQELAWQPCGCSHSLATNPTACWRYNITCQRCRDIVELEKIIYLYEAGQS